MPFPFVLGTFTSTVLYVFANATYCDRLQAGGECLLNSRDKNDQTPLHYAATKGSLQVKQLSGRTGYSAGGTTIRLIYISVSFSLLSFLFSSNSSFKSFSKLGPKSTSKMKTKGFHFIMLWSK